MFALKRTSLGSVLDLRSSVLGRKFVKEVLEEFHYFFFVWMLHGSTKVVVRAVALLSAKTK